MDHSAIKTIVFDLGGVVFTDGTRVAITKLSRKYNIPIEVIENLFNGVIGSAYRTGNLTIYEFWNTVKTELGIHEPPEKLSQIWLSGYKPIAGMFQILEQLRDKNFELLYLSDNVKERVDYLEGKYHFLNFFKNGVFSFSVGVRKPAVQIYEALLHMTKSLPEECLYIDDVEKFLEPASSLKMQTIHYMNSLQLAHELSSRGIEVNP